MTNRQPRRRKKITEGMEVELRVELDGHKTVVGSGKALVKLANGYWLVATGGRDYFDVFGVSAAQEDCIFPRQPRSAG